MVPEKLKDFPLLWRWTASSHVFIPQDALEQMMPIQREHAESLVEIELASAPTNRHVVADHTEADIQAWLLSQYPSEDDVVLVWSRELGLRLPWSIFCGYWSDFCYPSSDDVGIFTNSNDLLMRWHHDESFEYGYGSH